MPQSFCHLFYCVNQAAWVVSQEIHWGNNFMNTDNPVEKMCETIDNHLRKTVPLAPKNIHDFHWRYYTRKCLTLNHISPHYISGGPVFGEQFHSLTRWNLCSITVVTVIMVVYCFFSTNRTWQRLFYYKCFYMGEITDTEPLGYVAFTLWRSSFDNRHTCCYHSKYRLFNTKMYTAARLAPG